MKGKCVFRDSWRGVGYSQLTAVDPETVAPFVGSYNMEGATYTVELHDDRLWVSIGEWDYNRVAGSASRELRGH